MTTADLKYEITKAIDDAPESVLVDILDYLKQVKGLPKEEIIEYFRQKKLENSSKPSA